jgi:hypothetical protein
MMMENEGGTIDRSIVGENFGVIDKSEYGDNNSNRNNEDIRFRNSVPFDVRASLSPRYRNYLFRNNVNEILNKSYEAIEYTSHSIIEYSGSNKEIVKKILPFRINPERRKSKHVIK